MTAETIKVLRAANLVCLCHLLRGRQEEKHLEMDMGKMRSALSMLN